MTTQDFLYISLSLGFLCLVGFSCYMLYHLTQTIKSAKRVVDNTEDITSDVMNAKNQLKSGVLSGVSSLINLASVFFNKKGGEKNGRR
jgi:CHASE3 domain sensor protein